MKYLVLPIALTAFACTPETKETPFDNQTSESAGLKMESVALEGPEKLNNGRTIADLEKRGLKNQKLRTISTSSAKKPQSQSPLSKDKPKTEGDKPSDQDKAPKEKEAEAKKSSKEASATKGLLQLGLLALAGGSGKVPVVTLH